ncbi:chemotaxis protein CheW [Halostagnicola kamekurae]|uniref:Purine-binding chemotaxis protein CheW n=1 Tax=Halostagnicola kamekurae TaxID=619731 RepID=A0A1I6PSA7_9EURY|nr:chemotaxis protein CheW [Halostagnicola kamekurae]SFS43071.1 purine-binding chemotaxis protein CheW [Halostagnicola kamekurae]
MSEDTPDPDDQFEDQLSDVGSRTREKFSAEERKKAEKLGVSPGDPDESTADATDADTTDADGGTSAPSDTDADDDRAGVDAGTDRDGAAVDAESSSDDNGPSDGDDTDVSPDGRDATAPAAADRAHPSPSDAESTGSGAGTVYEYNDMNSKLEHDTESSVDDQRPTTEAAAQADTNQSSGSMAGLGGVTTGERMAVTKTEVDFVTGDEAQTNETEQTKLLYFELNDELFAAPLESISSVEELSGLTRYPRSPEPIDGVTDMRGKIIAVLNPKVIVDLSNASHENGAGGDYIIVQEEIEDEHRIGVRVDDISHVESASEESITPIYDITEMDLVTIDESYLEGIIHGYRADEQAQVPLVDFASLMETLKEY